MGRKISILLLVVALLSGLVLFAEGSKETSMEESGWKPTRPVQVICWAGAGGGTDLQSRAMAKALEHVMGQPFQVQNMTGGAGGIAANYAFNAKRDGYTILGMSEGVHGIPVLGAFDKTSEAFDMIMVLSTPGILSVPEDSPINNLDDLIAAAKKSTLKAASSQAGSIWAMKLLQFEAATGLKFNNIPYEGSHPSQVAALNGEVDVVITGMAEQKDYILAGKLKPICLIESKSAELKDYGTIPAVAEKFPKYKELPRVIQWVGMGFPADMPENIKKAYHEAWAEAVKSPEVKQVAETMGFSILGLQGDEMRAMAKELDSVFAWTLYDAGLAKVNPEKFNIPRP
jgi:putative tricarboxylic transport membrane protein